MKKFLLLVIIVSLASCYNEKKAVTQMSKGIEQYSDTARKLFRGKFPCITSSLDSTAFIASINDLKFVLYTRENTIQKNEQRLQAARDSIKKLMDVKPGEDCRHALSKALDRIAEVNLENIDLKDDMHKLQKQIGNIKPVINFIKDSSEIAEAYKIRDIAIAEKNKIQAGYDHYKGLWEADQKRNKGKLVIRIDWVLLVIGALGGGIFVGVKKWTVVKTFFSGVLRIFKPKK